MSPARAQATGLRLVATALTLMASTSVLAVVVALGVGAPLGPVWWSVPVLAAVVLALAACVRCAVKACESTGAAALLLLACMTALVSAHLLPAVTDVVGLPGETGGAAWVYFLGIGAVSAGAVCARGWGPARAGLAVVALALTTAALRSAPPLAGTPGSPGLVDAVFLTGLGLAVLGGVRGVEDVSGRLRSARAAAQRADDEAEQSAMAEAERSRWEAAVHDDVLSALRAAAGARSPLEQAAAASAAAVALEGLSAPASTLTVSAERTRQQLEAAAHGTRRGTAVHLTAEAGSLPGRVAEALVEVTTELLRNTDRHNGSDVTAQVRGHLSADLVRLVVSDDGRGFDVGQVAAGRLGLRVSVVGRMRSVGGSAHVESAPGRGVHVQLRWPR